MSRTKTICEIQLSLENIKYMLLIAKCLDILILKTTQYWDELRMVLDPCGQVMGRVMSRSLLLFLMHEFLVDCGTEKTLKLAVEYDIEWWMMVDSTWWQSD